MLNNEQQTIVDTLLHHRSPSAGYHYQSSIALTIQMTDTTWEQQYAERRAKEAEVRRLLTETFPAWKVGPFKAHPLRQRPLGLWIATIWMPEDRHSLLSMAYYLRWARQGLIQHDHYNAASCDPRWNEWGVSQTMREAEDPVQWVTDTYGDTLEKQFPMLIHTGRMGSGQYLVVANPEEDACEERACYRSPQSFEDWLDMRYELEWTAATNIQVDERKVVAIWQSKLARHVFEKRHPECFQLGKKHETS